MSGCKKDPILKSLLHLLSADLITLNTIDLSSRRMNVESSVQLPGNNTIDPGTFDIDRVSKVLSNSSSEKNTDESYVFKEKPSLNPLKFFKIIPIFKVENFISFIGIYKSEVPLYWCREFEKFTRLILRDDHNLSYEECFTGFLKSIEMKDHYTSGHSERVMFFTKMILNRMKLSDHSTIIHAALLHDIGKLTLDLSTLNCTKRLTEKQIQTLQEHPLTGLEILKPIQAFANLLPHVVHHHENHDGSGYPFNLAKDDIPIGARIIAVVDSFDAMTSDRVYRRAMSTSMAFEELLRYAGRQFDPDIVDIFISELSKNIKANDELPVFLQKEIHAI